MRRSNWNCIGCNRPMYRKPYEVERDVHKQCAECYNTPLQDVKCEYCHTLFHPKNKGQRYCNKSCSGYARRLGKYSKDKPKNINKGRLLILQNYFNFSSCMIDECTYNTLYEIHRYVPGKDGGKYEVGNMFAICPNHHAEVTRGYISLEKIDNQTLRIIK